MKSRFTLFLTAATLLLTACANPAPSDPVSATPLEEFLRLMERDFKTPDTNTDTRILDQRMRVNAPALEGAWLYTQLNTGDNLKLYRQRLNHFEQMDDGRIVQKSYSLKNAEDFENAWDNPSVFDTISSDDLIGFMAEGCEQNWTQETAQTWSGSVNPDSCTIVSKRRQKEIRIGSDSVISATYYKTSERGFELDGQFLWGSPVGEYITFELVDQDR